MPDYKVKVDMDNLPKGAVVEIPPFGSFKNGDDFTLEATRQEAEALATAHGVMVKTSGGVNVKPSAEPTEEEVEEIADLQREGAPQDNESEGGEK